MRCLQSLIVLALAFRFEQAELGRRQFVEDSLGMLPVLTSLITSGRRSSAIRGEEITSGSLSKSSIIPAAVVVRRALRVTNTQPSQVGIECCPAGIRVVIHDC